MLTTGRRNFDAFEETVWRHHTWAWKITYRFLGHGEEARDVAQHGSLRFLDASSRHRPISLLKTYFHSPLPGPGKKEATTAP